jgi:hypothetical protein
LPTRIFAGSAYISIEVLHVFWYFSCVVSRSYECVLICFVCVCVCADWRLPLRVIMMVDSGETEKRKEKA